MDCKYCGQPLEDGDNFCKSCGASVNESAVEQTPTAKKRLAAWKIVLLALGVVAVLGILAWAVLYGLGVELKLPENNIYRRDCYTVEDSKAAKKADVVIARVGDETLTNSELQVYYWSTAVEYIKNNIYYLSALGLDYTQPLSEQTCYLDKTMTWEQYFLDNAISVWHRYTAMTLLAKENDHTMDAETQAVLDGIPQSLEETAKSEGFETVQELLHSDLGAACTLEGYLSYWDEYYLVLSYINSVYDSMVPTDAEILEYISANEEKLNSYGVVWGNFRTVDVRHILVVPESAKEKGSAYGVTCSEEEWEACRAEAERILAEWKAGDATAESFGQLANTYSVDSGSNTKGGLYQEVGHGEMVAEFDAWIQDENNGVGATGIVKTVHGYHVMYLDAAGEFSWEDSQVELLMLEEKVAALVEDAKARWPMDVYYGKIVIGHTDLG